MTERTDILVIGAGMAGIGAAAEAAETANVVVLESEARPGLHATGRSAALLFGNYGNATLRALTAASTPVFEAAETFCDGPVLSPRGVLMLAGPNEIQALEAFEAGATGLARIGPDEAARLVPILRPERIAAAAHEPDARDIDVDRLLQGYRRRLTARGGRIDAGARVTGLARTGGVWRVETQKAVYEAPVVVNAAGGWADALAELAGITPIGLVPCRRSAAILPAPGGRDVTGWPLFGTVSETWYAKPDAGRLMVSPADEDPVAPHDVWPDDMVLAEGLDRYARAVTEPVTRVERSWAGMRTFAPDRTPVVGADPTAEGFVWLAGQGGYGIQTAPALSALAGALLTGGTPALPQAVVAALDPGRLRAA
ncbi:Hydrogen cyanide synthase subunit HcnC precursor [Roseivivax jejudonensis]|uniref:Hydrogen cyanide synthase subunit HcnC n=1 Tax=Roseivivax jejudonensis TaxID=1529041 RepID=A0A1X6Z1I8_9RHOB|nr:FAD-dependent oxidoreductase [Roseivivax jejudonensis]SLN38169.1 Hydrogen cyanide synthase subunit HcnC precursor [Roseivivax jejudonensis]